MPVYEVEMSDGRKFQVEADKPPTEADITEHLKGKPNTQTATSEQFAPKPDEGALINPPTTGGFIKNLGRDAMDMGKSMLQAGGARASAGRNFDAVGTTRPSNVANFVKSRAAADTDPAQIYQRPAAFLADAAAVADMAPGVGRGVMEAGRQVGRVSGPAGAMAKGAAMETPILGKMAKGAIRGLEKYNRASAPVESANAGGALAGKAPSLEDALNDALQSQMGPAKPTRTTAAPEPTITPSGKEGEFQSSGRPSVSGDAGYKPRFERAVGFEPEPPPDIDSAVDSELQSALEGASAGVPEEGMTLDEEGRPLAPAEKPMDPHYAEYLKSRQRSGNTFKTPAEADARNLAVDRGMGGKGADLPDSNSTTLGGEEAALEPEVDTAPEQDNDVDSDDTDARVRKLKDTLGPMSDEFDSQSMGGEGGGDPFSEESLKAQYDADPDNAMIAPPFQVDTVNSPDTTPRLDKGFFTNREVQPTKDWIATQDLINRGNLDRVKQGFDQWNQPMSREDATHEFVNDTNDNPPLIAVDGGKTYIIDGHHRATAGLEAGKPIQASVINYDNVPDRYVSDERDWHSGAKPGSAEAKRMSQEHRESAEMDAFYQHLVNDPSK